MNVFMAMKHMKMSSPTASWATYTDFSTSPKAQDLRVACVCTTIPWCISELFMPLTQILTQGKDKWGDYWICLEVRHQDVSSCPQQVQENIFQELSFQCMLFYLNVWVQRMHFVCGHEWLYAPASHKPTATRQVDTEQKWNEEAEGEGREARKCTQKWSDFDLFQ